MPPPEPCDVNAPADPHDPAFGAIEPRGVLDLDEGAVDTKSAFFPTRSRNSGCHSPAFGQTTSPQQREPVKLKKQFS
jgi:hypothetical protein